MTRMQVNYVYFVLVLFLSIMLLITGRIMVAQGYSSDEIEVERVSVEVTRSRAFAGESILICAYEGVEKYRTVALEGSISRESFREILKDVPMDKGLIFY